MANTGSEKLGRHLERAGKSQTDFATDLGVSRAYVTQILTGSRRPSLDVAARIEKLTGIAMREFAHKQVA